MVKFKLFLSRDFYQLVRFRKFQRDRFFEEHVLARGEEVARHRKVHVFGGGGNVDRVDLGIPHQILVVPGSAFRVALLRDFGKPLGPVLGQVQALHQRMRGAGFRANSAAPARTNHCHCDLTHRILLHGGGISALRVVRHNRGFAMLGIPN